MKALDDRRVWLGGGAVLALIITAVAYFLLISPKQDDTSALRDQAAATRAQNDTQRLQTARLRAQTKHISALTAKLAKSLTALPSGGGLTEFTVELTTLARQNHLVVDSISIAPPTPVTNSASSTGGTGATGAANAATGGTTEASGTQATTASTGTASGLYSISITLVTTGAVADDVRFHTALRAGARTSLVTALQANAPTSLAAGAKFTTMITVFSAPRSTQEQAVLAKLLRGDVSG